MATSKGHMACNKKNIRSITKKSTVQMDDKKDNFGPQKISVTSQASNKYVMVEYDYNSNSIIQVPVPNHSDSALTKTIDYTYS
eukprot:9733748-Ditylum_brightwellii.AAC.1